MTMTIEVTPEAETKLAQKARRHGQPLNDYVRDLLERDAEEPGGVNEEQQPLHAGAVGTKSIAAALALARELGPAIRAGTLKPICAADVIEANREERMRELDPRH